MLRPHTVLLDEQEPPIVGDRDRDREPGQLRDALHKLGDHRGRGVCLPSGHIAVRSAFFSGPSHRGP